MLLCFVTVQRDTINTWRRLDYFAENSFRLKTPQDANFFSNSLALNKPYFFFRIRACREVAIELLGSPGVHSTVNYYFVFGASDNTKGELYKNVAGSFQQVQSSDWDSFLMCDTVKLFWIAAETREDGSLGLEAGEGRLLHNNTILKYTDPEPMSVLAVSLSSSRTTQGTADWEFAEDSGLCRHMSLYLTYTISNISRHNLRYRPLLVSMHFVVVIPNCSLQFKRQSSIHKTTTTTTKCGCPW